MSYVPPEWHLSLQQDFRRNVHKLIAVGYQNALGKIKSGEKHEETHITGFIAEAIYDWLWSDEAKGFDGCEILDDPPERSYDDTRRGRGRLRSDFIISYTNSPRQRFVCEAKRLHEGRGSKYLDKEGIGCFISGNYARQFPEVAMLGYVETKSVPDWKDILQKHINSKSTELELIPPQEDINVIPEIRDEWRSRHRRDVVGSPVTIYHILLDCNC